MQSFKFSDGMRVVTVKNASAETCPPYGLLAITGVAKRGSRPVLVGDKPSTTFYREYVVNGPTAIPAGKHGECYITAGPQVIKYYSGTPLNGEGWGPKPGQWEAYKGFPGITVEGIKSSTRTILLGTLGEARTLLCLTTGTIGPAATSSGFTVQSGDPSSNANSGFAPPTVHLGMTIDSGKLFIAHWLNNCWVGMPWECNDE